MPRCTSGVQADRRRNSSTARPIACSNAAASASSNTKPLPDASATSRTVSARPQRRQGGIKLCDHPITRAQHCAVLDGATTGVTQATLRMWDLRAPAGGTALILLIQPGV